MYRTSIQLYIFPHMVTEPHIVIQRIQRDIIGDTSIQRDTPIHMYHHPPGVWWRAWVILHRPLSCGAPSFFDLSHRRRLGSRPSFAQSGQRRQSAAVQRTLRLQKLVFGLSPARTLLIAPHVPRWGVRDNFPGEGFVA